MKRIEQKARKQKRLESNFKQLLKSKLDNLTEQSKWEEVKGQIENENDYQALSSEADRIRLFEEHHRQVVAEAQAAAAAAAAAHHSHHHHKKARKEKKKRKHEKSSPAPVSVSRGSERIYRTFVVLFRTPMVKRKRSQPLLWNLQPRNQYPRKHRRVMKVKQKIVMVVHHQRQLRRLQ